MLRIGICDDEARAREQLRRQLQGILRQSDEDFFEFSSGSGVIHWLQSHQGQLDLLFLDIEMDGLNGLEAARKIREFDRDLLLVFVTGYEDFVFDGYGVEALDYIIKPAPPERLRQVLDRAESRLSEWEDRVLVVQSGGSLCRISHRDILYAYSDRRQVALVTARQEFTFYGKLDEVQQQLGEAFLRVHQRYLVQLRTVSRLEGERLYVGEMELPVSRSLKREVALRLARALVEEAADG